ncbi:MAG: ZIP family metal transporter, partial [Oscillospiraceae bacterium]|nr:ZIP family metal transporter [Oscillospiraceae bacterium]
MHTEILLGVSVPMLGTVLGAAVVFLFRGELNPRIQKSLLGFASGVMIAASVWSLLIPAIEMSEKSGGAPAWLPAGAGFLAGIGFLLLLDLLIPHIHIGGGSEGKQSVLGRSAMLVLAVTLHNIPEGMAVGVVFAGVLSGEPGMSLAAAFTLSAGIALQNLPEGAVVAMPMIAGDVRRGKAFAYGVLSGLVEPVAALMTVALTALITPALPFILAFAAGAMIYVVIEELIPEAQNGEHSNAGTVGAALGFVL